MLEVLTNGVVAFVNDGDCIEVGEDCFPISVRCDGRPEPAALRHGEAVVNRPILSKERPGFWDWWPFGNRSGSEPVAEVRRYTRFRVKVGGMCFFVDVVPVFVWSRTEYGDALRQLLAEAASAAWEDGPDLAGSSGAALPASPFRTLDQLGRELEAGALAFRGLLARPAREMHPSVSDDAARPGSRCFHFDLGENRVAAAWVDVALAVLGGWETVLSDARNQLEVDIGDVSDQSPEWVSELQHELDVLREHSDGLRGARERLVRLQRSLIGLGVGRAWTPTPAVLRTARPRWFALSFGRLQALRHDRTSAGSLAEVSPRPVSSVFEVWAAFRIIELLQAAGCSLTSVPTALGSVDLWRGLVVPRSLTWKLRFREYELTFSYGVRARTVVPAQVDLFMSERERVALAASATGIRRSFATAKETVSPDYVLLVTAPSGRVAWVVGDAVYADPRYPGGQSKVEDVSSKYVKHIVWISAAGEATPCAEGGAFVVVPAASERYHLESRRRTEANRNLPLLGNVEDRTGTRLVSLTPGDLGPAGDFFNRLLRSLVWRLGGEAG